jgi:hypothetical protein
MAFLGFPGGLAKRRGGETVEVAYRATVAQDDASEAKASAAPGAFRAHAEVPGGVPRA